MGFALPAAIGAKAACPEKDVWVIAGDGGFQMTAAELSTIVQESYAINIAVINNGFLGMVRQWQEAFYDKNYSASPILSPDFVALAAAHGIAGAHVAQRADVTPTVTRRPHLRQRLPHQLPGRKRRRRLPHDRPRRRPPRDGPPPHPGPPPRNRRGRIMAPIWIGLFTVSGNRDNPLLSGNVGACLWIAAQAEDAEKLRLRVKNVMADNQLVVTEDEAIEEVTDEDELSDAQIALIPEARLNVESVVCGTWHLYKNTDP